uniref:Methyltransferase domain-containing protein n=1 Tax=Streptomyces sp. NBC_00003 TaxID=2903608 RepID=A0AAU2V5Q0_9ACTN
MTEPEFLHATRTAYDTIACGYAEEFSAELEAKPIERAMLAAFAEMVGAAGGGPVADLGSGPGRVTAFLHQLGLAVFGVDLSPRMVALARQTYPDIRFDEGSMTALDVPGGSLGGIVAMYSVIHIPHDQLPLVFAEFHRVLAPGGRVLLVFQVGDAPVHRTEAFGRAIALDYYWRQPGPVVELLADAGLAVEAQVLRQPDATEKVPRAVLLVRKPGS